MTDNQRKYIWKLCSEIGKFLYQDKYNDKETPIVVYKDMILNTTMYIPMILSQRDLEVLKEVWTFKGDGFQVIEVAKKEKQIKVKAYYGINQATEQQIKEAITTLLDMAHNIGLDIKDSNTEVEKLMKEE